MMYYPCYHMFFSCEHGEVRVSPSGLDEICPSYHDTHCSWAVCMVWVICTCVLYSVISDPTPSCNHSCPLVCRPHPGWSLIIPGNILCHSWTSSCTVGAGSYRMYGYMLSDIVAPTSYLCNYKP